MTTAALGRSSVPIRSCSRCSPVSRPASSTTGTWPRVRDCISSSTSARDTAGDTLKKGRPRWGASGDSTRTPRSSSRRTSPSVKMPRSRSSASTTRAISAPPRSRAHITSMIRLSSRTLVASKRVNMVAAPGGRAGTPTRTAPGGRVGDQHRPHAHAAPPAPPGRWSRTRQPSPRKASVLDGGAAPHHRARAQLHQIAQHDVVLDHRPAAHQDVGAQAGAGVDHRARRRPRRRAPSLDRGGHLGAGVHHRGPADPRRVVAVDQRAGAVDRAGSRPPRARTRCRARTPGGSASASVPSQGKPRRALGRGVVLRVQEARQLPPIGTGAGGVGQHAGVLAAADEHQPAAVRSRRGLRRRCTGNAGWDGRPLAGRPRRAARRAAPRPRGPRRRRWPRARGRRAAAVSTWVRAAAMRPPDGGHVDHAGRPLAAGLAVAHVDGRARRPPAPRACRRSCCPARRRPGAAGPRSGGRPAPPPRSARVVAGRAQAGAHLLVPGIGVGPGDDVGGGHPIHGRADGGGVGGGIGGEGGGVDGHHHQRGAERSAQVGLQLGPVRQVVALQVVRPPALPTTCTVVGMLAHGDHPRAVGGAGSPGAGGPAW